MLTLLLLVELGMGSVVYYKNIFGNIHRRADRHSESIATISCAQKLENKGVTGDWSKVETGVYSGYVLNRFLSSKYPPCFQSKYPRFINKLNLSPSDRYLWGRLYDRYIYVEGASP